MQIAMLLALCWIQTLGLVSLWSNVMLVQDGFHLCSVLRSAPWEGTTWQPCGFLIAGGKNPKEDIGRKRNNASWLQPNSNQRSQCSRPLT